MAMWDQAASPFGQVTGKTLDFFEQSFNNVTMSLQGEFAKMVADTTRAIEDTAVYRSATAAMRRLRYIGTSDEVRELFDIGEFQNAPEKMEGLLTALPEYRELYNNNLAAGFEDGFSKSDGHRGSAIGLTDYHFRQVIDGMASEYSDHVSWTFNNAVGDATISKPDQIDVQKSWDTMRKLDWEDEDPLSSYNASVG